MSLLENPLFTVFNGNGGIFAWKVKFTIESMNIISTFKTLVTFK